MTQQDEGSLRSQASGEVGELRDRVAREISAVDGHAGSVEPCGDATYEQMADAAMAVVTPELERRDAELITQNRLYRKVGAERDEKQFEVERLRRWVHRFRAALKPPPAGLSEEEVALVEEAMRAVEADSAGHWPTVAGWLHAEVLRLRGLLATGAAPSRGSATSEASQDVMHDDLANSPVEDRSTWARVEPDSINRVGSASTPPAAGEADTTPPSNEWMCGDCGHPETPFGITDNSWQCVQHKMPRVWRKGDPEPADHPDVVDGMGDGWSWNPVSGLWASLETAEQPWAYVAKHWAPLVEVLPNTEQEAEK